MKRKGYVQMVGTSGAPLGGKSAGELILDSSLIDKIKSFKENISTCQS
jgi:hypothetical protein